MRARLGTSDLTILVIAGLSIAALTVVSVLMAPVDSSPRVPGSSYSTEPDGTRAAYLVLKELGHDVSRSFEPIASLRAEPADTILVLANPTERPSKGDQQALRSFVNEGGVVLAFGLSADRFLPGVTPVTHQRRDQSLDVFQAALPGPLTRGAREVSAFRSRPPSLDPAYVPLYGTSDHPAIVVARVGDGFVIWSFDQSLVENEGIARGANVTFIANAAGIPGARAIAWDEHYHGQRRSFWSYLAGTPLMWGGAQLAVIALLLVAGTSRRRGPLRSTPVESRASPIEFVETMAALYERAGDARAAVEAARNRLRRRLGVVLGMAPSMSDDQLAAGAARIGLDATRIRQALNASGEALSRGVPTSTAALPLVAELQELTALTVAARAGRQDSRIARESAKRRTRGEGGST